MVSLQAVLDAPLSRFKQRLFSNKLVVALFIVSILHAIIQISLQADSISIHSKGLSTLVNIQEATALKLENFTDSSMQDHQSSSVHVLHTASSTSSDASQTSNQKYGDAGGNNNSNTNNSSGNGNNNDDNDDIQDDDQDNDHDNQLDEEQAPQKSSQTSENSQSGQSTSHHQFHDDDINREQDVPHHEEFEDKHRNHRRRQLLQIVRQHKRTSSSNDNYTSSLPSSFSALASDLQNCQGELDWFETRVKRYNAESAALIVLQVWIVFLVLAAIMSQSTPHLLAVLVSSFFAFIFSIQSLAQLSVYRQRYLQLENDGTCSTFHNGIARLVTIGARATPVNIAITVLQGIVCIVIGVLAWYLRKLYGWQTFQYVGASRTATRLHYLHLCFQTLLETGVYFITVFFALWLNVLNTNPFTEKSFQLSLGFRVFLGIIGGLVPGWIILGWLSLSKKLQNGMMAFCLYDFVLISVGVLLCTQSSFCQTTIEYIFLLIVGIVSAIICIGLLVTAVLCLVGFRKGVRPDGTQRIGSMCSDNEKSNLVFPDVRPAYFSKDFSDQTSLFTDCTSKTNSTTIILGNNNANNASDFDPRLSELPRPPFAHSASIASSQAYSGIETVSTASLPRSYESGDDERSLPRPLSDIFTEGDLSIQMARKSNYGSRQPLIHPQSQSIHPPTTVVFQPKQAPPPPQPVISPSSTVLQAQNSVSSMSTGAAAAQWLSMPAQPSVHTPSTLNTSKCDGNSNSDHTNHSIPLPSYNSDTDDFATKTNSAFSSMLYESDSEQLPSLLERDTHD